MRIMKFGGTSVATAERLTTVARLVTAGLERGLDLPLADLSQDDAEEIAWHGGRVLHRRALEPLAGRDIPLFIRNRLSSTRNTLKTGCRLFSRLRAEWPPGARGQ